MIGEHTRSVMIGAINRYCIKNGLPCVTCVRSIEKRLESELEAIGVELDEMLFGEAKHQKEIDNLRATNKKNIDGLLDKIEMLESLLNEEQKEKYLEYCDSQKSNELNIADEEVVDA